MNVKYLFKLTFITFGIHQILARISLAFTLLNTQTLHHTYSITSYLPTLSVLRKVMYSGYYSAFMLKPAAAGNKVDEREACSLEKQKS